MRIITNRDHGDENVPPIPTYFNFPNNKTLEDALRNYIKQYLDTDLNTHPMHNNKIINFISIAFINGWLGGIKKLEEQLEMEDH